MEHPNAYDPWTEQADCELRQLWEDGKSVEEIARHFGRKPSDIVVRMKNLDCRFRHDGTKRIK